MTKEMILYAIVVLLLSINIGIFIKMKSFKPSRKTFLYVPIIIPLVFLFNFKYGIKLLRKENYSRLGYKKFFWIISFSFSKLSLLTGLVCNIIVDIQKDIEKNMIKKKSIAKVNDREKYYEVFESNFDKRYKEILC